MAFKEYRNSIEVSMTHELDVERFAFDVFAYMLRICGVPEIDIPRSSLKDNNYTENDFIMNVGLSSLPIALYMRDKWRSTFEEIFGKSGYHDLQVIQNYLESFILHSGEFEQEDILGKIQFSLAMYNECILFLDFRGVETHFAKLPKLWTHFCTELFAQSEDSDQILESSFLMCPDLSESWISSFIRKFAIPYGSSNDVSDRFSLLTLESHAENDTFNKETSMSVDADSMLEESVIQPSKASDQYTVNFFPESSKSELSDIPGTYHSTLSSGQLQTTKENAGIEKTAQGKHKNGLTYVLQKCFKGRKRSRSQKLEVVDAFGKISLEKENISPETSDSKRRRKISNKNTPE